MFYKSITFRVITLLFVICVIIFAPLTILLLDRTRNSLEQQALDSAVLANGIVLHATRYSMLKNDRQGIALTLKSLSKVPELEGVQILGKKTVAFSSRAEEIGSKVDRNAPQCIVCHQVEPALTEIPAEQAFEIVMQKDGDTIHRVLVRVDPIFNSASCSMTRCHPSPEKQKVLGVLETKISLAKPDAAIAQERKQIIIFGVGGVFLMESLSALFLWGRVHRRVKKLTEGNRQIAAGNLDHRINDRGNDELGELAESFNVMTGQIQRQRSQITDLVENIAVAVSTMTSTTPQLLSIAAQQASGASEQVTTVQELVSTTEELSATATRISGNVDAVNQSADQTCQVCDSGRVCAQGSIGAMKQIKDHAALVAQQILELADQARLIGGVIDIIEEISEQTNLLSLNAALEAAGAGEFGQRFGVVAAEVRRLAGRTLESTVVVKKNVARIQGSVSSMVTLGDREQQVVGEGLESVADLVMHFEQTLEMVEQTRAAAAEIRLIAQQQSSATQQMVTAIREVEDVSQQAEQGAKQIESVIAELNAMSEQLRALVERKDLLD